MGWGHGHMARGGHGLLKVSYGPAMPNLLCPAGGPPLKQPYSLLIGGLLTGRATCDRLIPFGHPTPYAYGWGDNKLRRAEEN
jgi:hypothetical protein